MPAKPRKFEPHGSRRTEQARKREVDELRGNSHQRGYDRAWQKLRSVFLREHPLCTFCAERGCITPAQVVDHITSIALRPDLRLVRENLRSLCKRCHDSRTATDQGFARKPRQ